MILYSKFSSVFSSQIKVTCIQWPPLPSPFWFYLLPCSGSEQRLGSLTSKVQTVASSLTRYHAVNPSTPQCPLLYTGGSYIFLIVFFFFFRIKWVKWKAPRIVLTHHQGSINIGFYCFPSSTGSSKSSDLPAP